MKRIRGRVKISFLMSIEERTIEIRMLNITQFVCFGGYSIGGRVKCIASIIKGQKCKRWIIFRFQR